MFSNRHLHQTSVKLTYTYQNSKTSPPSVFLIDVYYMYMYRVSYRRHSYIYHVSYRRPLNVSCFLQTSTTYIMFLTDAL